MAAVCGLSLSVGLSGDHIQKPRPDTECIEGEE